MQSKHMCKILHNKGILVLKNNVCRVIKDTLNSRAIAPKEIHEVEVYKGYRGCQAHHDDRGQVCASEGLSRVREENSSPTFYKRSGEEEICTSTTFSIHRSASPQPSLFNQ
jgi:hypothetical protein